MQDQREEVLAVHPAPAALQDRREEVLAVHPAAAPLQDQREEVLAAHLCHCKFARPTRGSASSLSLLLQLCKTNKRECLRFIPETAALQEQREEVLAAHPCHCNFARPTRGSASSSSCCCNFARPTKGSACSSSMPLLQCKTNERKC